MMSPRAQTVLAFALAALLSTLISGPAQAQGSALDYLDKANLDRATSPEQAAAKHFTTGERHLHKAKRAQEKAGAPAELVAKARAEYERAAAEFEKALAKNPTLIEAHLLVGQVYARLGEPRKSLSSCHQAWSMDAKRSAAALCEAQAHLALDQPRAAQEIYLRLKNQDSADASAVLAAIGTWVEDHHEHTSAPALTAWIEQQETTSP